MIQTIDRVLKYNWKYYKLADDFTATDMAAVVKALENWTVVNVIAAQWTSITKAWCCRTVWVERSAWPVTFSTDLNPQQQICNHESDWMVYTSNPPQSKCKKCWVFYFN